MSVVAVTQQSTSKDWRQHHKWLTLTTVAWPCSFFIQYRTPDKTTLHPLCQLSDDSMSTVRLEKLQTESTWGKPQLFHCVPFVQPADTTCLGMIVLPPESSIFHHGRSPKQCRQCTSPSVSLEVRSSVCLQQTECTRCELFHFNWFN